MKGVTRHTFDRAALKVATTAFDREFCRQVEKGVQTLPLVVIPPSAAPAKPALSWADIVFEKDGVPMTNSYKVAEVFEREHRNVLATIDELGEIKADFPALSGWLVEHTAARSGGGRANRWFEMTRDGFMLVAMRLKGEKATRFQIGFIHAFNAMETELRRRIEEDRIKALAEAKAALADAERGRKQADGSSIHHDQRSPHTVDGVSLVRY